MLQFRRSMGIGFVVLCLVYLLLVVYPAYSSGIDRITDTQTISKASIDLPLYVNNGNSPIGFVGMLTIMAGLYCFIPFSLLLVGLVIRTWQMARLSENIFWLVVSVGMVVLVELTKPGAAAVAAWLLDLD